MVPIDVIIRPHLSHDNNNFTSNCVATHLICELHFKNRSKIIDAKMFYAIFYGVIAIVCPLIYIHVTRQEMKLSEDLPAERTGESCVRRSALSPKLLLETIDSSVTTMYGILKHASAQFPNKKQWGTRTLVKTHVEEKTVKGVVKTWTFPEYTGYTFMTYAEIEKKCVFVGAGLVKSGAGKTMAIFAPTSREWSLMAHSCWSQGITIATAYDSLGPEGLSHALNEGKLASLFTSTDLLKVVRGVIPLVKTLSLVVFMGDAKSKDVVSMKADFPNVKFMSIDELEAVGKEFPLVPSPGKSSDTACLMYTSGSTGTPKGVIISHANLVSASIAIQYLY